MMQFAIVGLGAGAAAALLFAASVVSGVWFSVFLLYLTPLPLMIAGLGWNHWVAVLASASAATALGVTFGTVLFFSFLAAAAIPSCCLCYLATLSRPVAMADGAPAVEWYPPGRLVVWAAVLATAVVIVASPNFGTDAASFRAALHDALANLLNGIAQGGNQGLAATGISDRAIDLFVLIVPPTAAVLATLTNVFNLWLAGRVVKFSARLTRPWPVLSEMRFPLEIALALAVSVAVSLIGGLAGLVAGVFSAALLMAYAVLGFAVLHAITQGRTSRPFVLGGIYAAVFVLGWPMLGLCALGLSDSLFDWRARLSRRSGLPAPP
jgi:hypothetical protein